MYAHRFPCRPSLLYPAPFRRVRKGPRGRNRHDDGRQRGADAGAADSEAAVAGPDFYKESRTAIEDALARVESTRREIDRNYRRWDELDSRVR